MKVQIIGVGGSGSNLAYLLSRNENIDEMVLVDFDVVERKNLERQFFTTEYIDKPKVEALKELLMRFNPNLNVKAYKIEINKENVEVLEKDVLTILATDSLDSKRIIADHCTNIFIVNCDRDEYEVKPELDERDRNAWVLKSGYNSTQNFFSNMMAAMEVYRQIYLGIKETTIYDSTKGGTQ